MKSNSTSNKTFKMPIMVGVLGLQVAVAAALFWQNSQSNTVTSEPLIAAPATSINKIALKSDDGEVTLAKQGEAWLEDNGLPVESQRVDALLDKLTAIKSGWPLATSASAQERFEVGEQKFQRKISVYSGDVDQGTLYLGSSVSYKQVHVRSQNSSDIYAANFNVYDAPTNANAWLDTTLLQPKGDVTVLQSGDFKIAKVNGEWPKMDADSVHGVDAPVHSEANPKTEVSDALASNTPLSALPDSATEQPELNEEDAEAGFKPATIVSALENLRVMGVADNIAELDAPEVSASDSKDEDALYKIAMEITTTEGVFKYELLSKKSQYYIRRNDYGVTFKLAKSQYEALAELAKQKVS